MGRLRISSESLGRHTIASERGTPYEAAIPPEAARWRLRLPAWEDIHGETRGQGRRVVVRLALDPYRP